MLAKIAYFRICGKCGRHGCIMLADGKESREVIAVDAGLDLTYRLRKLNLIAADEAGIIEQQVREAGLPQYRENADLEGVLCMASEAFERLALEIRASNEEFAENAGEALSENDKLLKKLMKDTGIKPNRTLH